MQDLTIVFENNNEAVTSSRLVAEYFGKQHKSILRAIRNLNCSKEFNEHNFAPVEYTDKKGETRQEYLMTKDGFTILAMGFTGAKAMQFKEAYINAFNKMQNLLKSNDRIMQLEQRILTLEEAKEPFNNFSDESILQDFFKAIKKELDTKTYYIKKQNSSEKHTGQLLGVKDFTSYHLIAKVAYDIYKNNTKNPLKRPTLHNLLIVKKIIIPIPEKNLSRKKINGKLYLCFAFSKEKFEQYI